MSGKKHRQVESAPLCQTGTRTESYQQTQLTKDRATWTGWLWEDGMESRHLAN